MEGSDGPRSFKVATNSLEQAVSLVLQPLPQNVTCTEEGTEVTVTPIPSMNYTPLPVTRRPTPTRAVGDSPEAAAAGSEDPARWKFAFRSFPKEPGGPAVAVTRQDDNTVLVKVSGAPREVPKVYASCPQTDPVTGVCGGVSHCLEGNGSSCRRWGKCLARDPDSGRCLTVETERAAQHCRSSGDCDAPQGWQLRYGWGPYSGHEVRPELGRLGSMQAAAAGGNTVTVNKPGIYFFEAVQERLDGSEPARSRTVVMGLGYAAFFAGDVSSQTGSSSLVEYETATPLPTLEGGVVRPARPALSSGAVEFLENASGVFTGVRVRLTLSQAAPAGTAVEYRYWPHSGFLPRSESEWPWRRVATWQGGSRRTFTLTDSVRWFRRDANGKFLVSSWDFQVRLARTAGGRTVYGEPSPVRSVTLWGPRTVTAPADP